MNRKGPYTVAVCTYNQAEMLRATLESLNRSEVEAPAEVRFLVVDNNSKDGTRQVCEAFKKEARFSFRSCFERRQGLSHARNRAIREAEEGILIFTDDDVVVPTDWVQRYISAFSDEAVDSVFGRIIPDWSGPEPEWFHPRLSATFAALDYGEVGFRADSIKHQFFGANFACSVEALKAVGGFHTRLGRTAEKLHIGEETKVFKKLLAQNRIILYDPDILVHHVIQEDRKTREYVRRYFKDTAESIVRMTEVKKGRSFLGIPYYKYREGIKLYSRVLPAWVTSVLTGDRPSAFVEGLEFRKFNRTIALFLKDYIKGPFQTT